MSALHGIKRRLPGAIMFLVLLHFPAVLAMAQETAGATGGDPPASLREPLIETMVVQFDLQRTVFESLSVPDLDVVPAADGSRYLPLLRLLRELEIVTAWAGTTASFSAAGREVRVGAADGSLSVGEDSLSVSILTGTSDVSGRVEVFLPDSTVALILSLDLEWNGAALRYLGKTEAVYPRFLAMSSQAERKKGRVDQGPRPPFAAAMPDLHGRARPGFDLWGADFLKLRLRSTGNWSRSATAAGQWAGFGSLNSSLYGSFLGGRYFLSATQNGGRQAGSAIQLQDGTWSLRGNTQEVAAGDGIFGLSGLTFPSVRAFGVMTNGVLGLEETESGLDSSDLGRRTTFSPAVAIEGEAPVGSQVELQVNGRVVDSRTVEEPLPDRPHTGFYSFRGLNLTQGRSNLITAVIRHPDGTTETREREVLGSNRLLQRGQLAYVGAAGTRRYQAVGQERLHGEFMGARMLYGITSTVTLGATAARQRQFSDLRYAIGAAEEGPILGDDLVSPEESAHVGFIGAWRVLDPLLLTAETSTATSDDWGTSSAWTGAAEIQLGALTMTGDLFRFPPEFFDGVNDRLHDRRGESAGLEFRLDSSSRLRLAAGRVRRYDGAEPDAKLVRAQDVQSALLSLGSLLPRTSVTFRGDRVATEGAGQRTLTRIEVGSGPLPNWRLAGEVSLGEDLRDRSRKDLLEGVSLPGIGTYAFPTTRLELTYTGSRTTRLRSNYFDSPGLERLSAGFSMDRGQGSRWLTLLDLGIEQPEQELFCLGRLDYFLTGNRQSRVGVEARRMRGSWMLSLAVEAQSLFGMLGGRPAVLSDPRLDPQHGGVRGRVFLDADGDGVLDPGEEGIEGVTVLTEDGASTVTGPGGGYLIMSRRGQREITVGLEGKSLSAIYDPTHGKQVALIRHGRLTEVNLGLAISAAILGAVWAEDGGGARQPLAGVRVVLDDDQGRELGCSVTAPDGTYYLGEVRPGRRIVRLDPGTIPPGYRAPEASRAIEVVVHGEFVEIEDVDFKLEAPEGEGIPASDQH